MPSHISLYVPGKPPLKRRHRHTITGLTYVDPKTRADEERVIAAWEAKGRPTLPDGPVRIGVVCVFERPKSHLKADGTLTKQGLKFPFPTSQLYGDWDNLGKSVSDALNGRAFADDSFVVDGRCEKRWAIHEPAHTKISLEVVDGGLGVAGIA